MITADGERAFYDNFYSQFLSFPDDALVYDRQRFLADLSNPLHPMYERRQLYTMVWERLSAEKLEDKVVLDYGCGTGDWGLVMAAEGARVTLLDLSPVAIELALRRARVSGVGDRVRGFARDASDLSCFADGEFDLIFGSAALHHTLKYPHALSELVRVLKPGGKLLLVETYGNNWLLNLARRALWKAFRQPAEQGEGLILDDAALEQLRRCFRKVEVAPVNFFAMAKRLFRGRFARREVRLLLHALMAMDAVFLSLFPSLRRYCGEVMILASRRCEPA